MYSVHMCTLFFTSESFFHAVRTICEHRTIAGFLGMQLGLLFPSRKQLFSELSFYRAERSFHVSVLSSGSEFSECISIFHY